jgi:hypothetical protein
MSAVRAEVGPVILPLPFHTVGQGGKQVRPLVERTSLARVQSRAHCVVAVNMWLQPAWDWGVERKGWPGGKRLARFGWAVGRDVLGLQPLGSKGRNAQESADTVLLCPLVLQSRVCGIPYSLRSWASRSWWLGTFQN